MTGGRLWTNGRILTLAADGRIARELFTRGERIVAVGDDLRAQLGAAEATEIVDLEGRTVVPGLMDCHLHFTMTALGLVDPRLDRAASLAELLELVRDGVQGLPPDHVYRGWLWDESRYPEGRGPTRRDLDAVAPRIPVVLFRVGGNVAAVNSPALGLLDLPPALPGVDREESGAPTGVLRGEANFFVQLRVHARLTREERTTAYRALGALAASRGLTTVHAIEGALYSLLRGDRSYPNEDVSCLQRDPPDVSLDLVIWDTQVTQLAGDLARIRGLGLPRVGGDIFVDGVLGVAWVPGVARAAISEPYLDGDRGLGHLLADEPALTDLFERSLEAGLQVSCHAVGDRAIGRFLDCFGRAVERVPRADARPRIEHGILATDAQIARAAELGVVFSVQPAFEWQSGGPRGRYAQRLGPIRVRRTHPLRQLVRAGVVLAGGSDSPANVMDPLLGIHAAVHHATEENRLSPVEALRVFTIGAAWGAFEEQEKGTLEPGKLADFVVLADDPTRPGAAIKDIPVVRTVHRGRDSYVRID